MRCVINAVHELNNARSAQSAANAGATEVDRMLQAAVLGFNNFTADAVSSRRTSIQDVQEGTREFLAALDRHFAPNDDAAYLEWTTMPSRSLV